MNRLTTLIYADDDLLINPGDRVIFTPTEDLPPGYDLDGEYLGRFDAYRVSKDNAITVRVIRHGEKLWLPLENVFYADRTAERVSVP